MDVTNENDFNVKNDIEMDSILNEFQRKADEGENETTGADNTENQDGKSDDFSKLNDALEGIPLSDLLSLMPPEFTSSLLSPTLAIYKASLSKKVDSNTYVEIENLLRPDPRYTEIKKEAFNIYMKTKMPNWETVKVNPLLILFAVDMLQTSLIAKQVNGYVREKGFLFDGEHHGKPQDFKNES